MTTSIETAVSGVVLVVDDNAASRYVAGSWLRRHNYRVVEAETGAEALAVLSGQRVDIVVLDVGLPDMSGFDVCQRIKTDPGMGQPVIHLSATSIRAADRVLGLNRGADAYLTEPVEPDELLATIEAVLRYYRARATAEELASRLTRLSQITHDMHAANSFDQLARVLAGGAASLFHCRAIALVPITADIVRRATVRPGGEASLDNAPPEFTRALNEAATQDGKSPSVRRASLPSESPPDPGWEAFLVGNRTGHAPLCVAVQAPRLQPDQASLLTQLGQAAVLAANSLRLYTEEHSLALTLQHSFLPDRAPRIPGLEIAVRYVPAATTAEIGGDFYDVIELDDDRLLIAIGDVAGHSIHAATVMVELRHALRAYAVEGHDPAEIVVQLERMLRRFHPTEYATLCLLLLDRRADQLHVVNAGHLPPLMVDAEGTRYLEEYGPMLGLGSPRTPGAVFALPPHWSVVLITDGLIEEPGVDLDTAMERLRASVPGSAHPDRLCTMLLDRFTRRQDDIALLVLRKPPAS